MKFYICSKFCHYASICIGAERLENWFERSGAAFEKWPERDATERH